MREFGVIGLIALGLALADTQPQSLPNDPPGIELAPNGGASWTATYRLAAPTNQLAFWKDSKGERSKQWAAGQGFEIVADGTHDILRRKDGSPFTLATVSVPLEFNSAAQGFFPFIPFSGQRVLVYTAEFLACPDKCPVPPLWSWKFNAEIDSSKQVIVHGRVKSGATSWTDPRQGSLLFIGNTKLIKSRSFTAVIDPLVPESVRESLRANFPKFMDFFSQHLGPPAVKPTLFLSYDEHYPNDTGSAAARISNDIFMHIYGELPQDPNYGVRRITWYFAHEAGHDFQRADQSQSPAEWWIHEGAAEEFAAQALAQTSPELAAYVQTRFEPARRECAEGLRQSSLHDALANGHHDLNYPCGLVLQARFDHDIRKVNPKSDGIFALWREYRARVEKGEPPVTGTYLACVESLAGKATADWARHIINDHLSDPTTVLAEGAD
jgi:hypothetical protein